MTVMRRAILTFGIVVLCFFVIDVVALAQGVSDDYRIDESFIGPGSNLESNSTNYSTEAGQSAVGSTGAVESASDTFQTQGGSETTDDPRLRCELDAAALNFGAFSIGATSTATATFRVLNYTSYGYNVSIIGDAPKIGDYELTPLTSNAGPAVGQEQFGINLVANTDPVIFGAFPVQVPDSDFSFGDAAPSYASPDNYRYVEGETIASAPKSSGQTNYTISYIVNIATTTPGGTYSGDQVILCTGTY